MKQIMRFTQPIRLYGTDAIVFKPNLATNRIQQMRGLGVCPWGCRRVTHSKFLIGREIKGEQLILKIFTLSEMFYTSP